MERLRRLLRPFLGLALFFLLWQVATLGNKATDVPPPYLVFRGLNEILLQGVLARNVVASVFRVAWGFTLATLVGVPVGIALGRSRYLHELFNPPVQLLRHISPIAWLP